MIKNLPTMLETWVLSLGWEDPLEKGMATQFIPETHPGAQANGGDMSTSTVLSSFIFISHPNTSMQETPPKSGQHGHRDTA